MNSSSTEYAVVHLASMSSGAIPRLHWSFRIIVDPLWFSEEDTQQIFLNIRSPKYELHVLHAAISSHGGDVVLCIVAHGLVRRAEGAV